ncbi:ZIP family metal transporter [Candidatus Woesearchaeota archaeon]|nr:ZIP family metal transporter [Candidatus Woesearchaeota archaeon]
MSAEIWVYSLVSVLLVSLVSLIGVVTLSINDALLSRILLFMVSFAAGSLFGGAFFHLIPEAVQSNGITAVSVYVVLGIVIFFILEKFIHWRHCHVPTSRSHPHPLGTMNLVGDGFHNLIDGIVVAASYMVSIPLGISTTLAVLLHEVPQEMGDFSILLHAGFRKTKALLFNFASALTAVLGALIALTVGSKVAGFSAMIIPFTAGGFIYIAGSWHLRFWNEKYFKSRFSVYAQEVIVCSSLSVRLAFSAPLHMSLESLSAQASM